MTAPAGFIGRAGFLSSDEDQLLRGLIRGYREDVGWRANLQFGRPTKRRFRCYGYHYESGTLELQDGVPGILIPLRERVSRFAGLLPEVLEQITVSRYVRGEKVGPHMDWGGYGDVACISLGSEGVLKFTRENSPPLRHRVEPGSLYILRGESRWAWKHETKPAWEPRYAITFRPFRPGIPRSGQACPLIRVPKKIPPPQGEHLER